MKYTIPVFIILFATTPMLSQQTDDLNLLLQRDNPELKALQYNYQAALEKAPQLSQRPDPELGIGAFVLPVETRLGPQWLRIGVTQMLARRGELQANKELALLMASASKEDIASTRIQQEYQLSLFYYQLYELSATEQIIRDSRRLYELMENMSLAKVEAGKTSIADVLQIQLSINDLDNELLQLSNLRDAQLAGINQLLNRELDSHVSLPDSLEFASLDMMSDSLLSQALSAHPQIKKLEWQQQVADQRLRLNQIQQRASFGVGLDYIIVGKRNDAEPPHNGRDILMPRASVRIPLNKVKYAAKEQEEHLMKAGLEFRKAATLNDYKAEIEKALARYRNAVLQLQLYHKQSEILEATLRIVRESYSQAAVPIEEWLRLQQKQLDLEKMKLKAITNSYLAKASVMRFLDIE